MTNHENPDEIKVVSPEIVQPSAPCLSDDQENHPLLDNQVVVVPRVEEQHSQAVPIGNYHRREDIPESTDELAEQLEQLVGDQNSESSNDSSETIPSHWTPFPQTSYERSISLETPANLMAPVSVIELIRSNSFPPLSPAHIRLAEYQPISPPGKYEFV